MTGDDLKERREAMGLTQVDLAARVDIHPISLSRYERGVDPIPLMMELALCELERRLNGGSGGKKEAKPKKKKPTRK